MPPVSRQEVLARREEMMEDVVARIVPEIDEKLLQAKRFPVVYEISMHTESYANLGDALVEIYKAVGWNVRHTYRRDSLDSYGDQKGDEHQYVCFFLNEPEGSTEKD